MNSAGLNLPLGRPEGPCAGEHRCTVDGDEQGQSMLGTRGHLPCRSPWCLEPRAPGQRRPSPSRVWWGSLLSPETEKPFYTGFERLTSNPLHMRVHAHTHTHVQMHHTPRRPYASSHACALSRGPHRCGAGMPGAGAADTPRNGRLRGPKPRW